MSEKIINLNSSSWQQRWRRQPRTGRGNQQLDIVDIKNDVPHIFIGSEFKSGPFWGSKLKSWEIYMETTKLADLEYIIVPESERYAHAFLCMNYITGYHIWPTNIPTVKCYWSTGLASGASLFANIMPRAKFVEKLHFINVNQSEVQLTMLDRAFKIRPNKLEERNSKVITPYSNI